MRAESCRDWRESLGAYTLGHLSPEERVKLEAHLDGCPDCRAEADSLGLVARLLPHADPQRFGPAPLPPVALGERIATQIGAEQRGNQRRRRFRLGLAMCGATAALAAAALAIFILPPGGGGGAPTQRVAFRSLPSGVKITATLTPQSYGTEISMYVSGIRSGTLCRVFLRTPGGAAVSAGTFRYRWGGDSEAVLSSALDLSRAQALVVHAGGRTFAAPVDTPASTST
jgi:putative zinc finger protein